MKKLSKITIATAISALAICAVSISASAVDRTFSSSGTLYVTEEDEIIEATCIQISNMTVGGLYELAPTDIVSATISAANEEDTSAWSVEFDSYSTDWSGWTGPASEPGVLELTATVQEMMDAIEVDDISEFGGFVLYVRNCQEGDEIDWTITIEPGAATEEPDEPEDPVVPEEPTVPDVPEEPEDPVDPVEKDINLLSSGSLYLEDSTAKINIYNEWLPQSDAIIVDSDDFVDVGSISVRIKVSDMSKPFNVWICYADYNWEYVYWEEDDEGNLNASSDTVLINGDGYYVINLSIDGYPSGLAYMAVYTDLESDVDDIPSITVDAIRVNGVLEDTDGETKIEVKYEYTELYDGTLEITDCSGNATDIVIPSEIDGKKVTGIGYYAFADLSATKSITIPEGVTYIGGYAFSGCSSLTSVTIPDSVTTIESYAFSSCEKLTTITIPEGVTSIQDSTFEYCSSLTSVNIPESVKSIGWSAFSCCSSLTSVTIPDSVTILDYYSFYGCSSLETITIPDSVTYIGTGAFCDCSSLTSVTIPAGVTEMGGRVFAVCTSLKSINVDSDNEYYVSENGVLFDKEKTTLIAYPPKKTGTSYTIPNTVTNISDSAFAGCSSLSKIDISDTVTYIGDTAFSGCSSLKSVTIPDGVTDIYESTFYGCLSLTSITIPDSVTYIGESVFAYCESLTSVTIPGSVTEIGYSAFSDCSMLSTVNISEGVTSIGGYAFAWCYELETIDIPDSVEYLGDYIFSDCYSLESINVDSDNEYYTSVNGVLFNKDKTNLIVYPAGKTSTSYTIPTGVTVISRYAFADCSALTSVIIPKGVTTINNYAFSWCNSLKSITIPESVTSIGAYTFNSYSSDLVISCYENSVAHQFAIDYGINYELIKPVVPAAVEGFKSPSKSTTAIRLNWDKNDDATGYIIEQYNGSKWVQIADITDNTTVTYKVTGLNPGTAYKFRMKAYNDSGASAYTATLTVNTQMTAVKGFKSPSKSTTAIRLGWTKNAYATGYIVEQYDGKSWVQIADITDNATVTYKVTGLVPGTAYKFRMKAYSVTKYGETIYGDKTATLTINTQMTAVKDFAGTSKSTSSIDLSWTKNAYADGYIIEQYDGSAWTQIADITDPATVTYKVTGLKSGTAYKFRMKAYSITKYDETIYGDKTATLTVNTRASAVKDFALKSRSSTALRLKWTKNTAVDGYIIEQYIDGQWVQIAEIEGNATTEYKVTGLKASTKYKFRMKSYVVTKYDEKTYSAYTSVLTKTTNPSTVSDLTVKSKAQTAIRLAWSKNTSATGYCIEQYKDGKWVQVAKIESNATLNYRIDGLTKATTYKFRVRAYNIVGTTTLYSDYKTISATTNS